jgi:hypothetical protein
MGGLSVEEVRRRQSLGGRIGAAKKHLLFGGPSMAEAARARRAYRASFEVAHGGDPAEYASLPQRLRPVGLCRACPERIEVPASATPEQRREFADGMRSMHYGRLAIRAVARRKATR